MDLLKSKSDKFIDHARQASLRPFEGEYGLLIKNARAKYDGPDD